MRQRRRRPAGTPSVISSPKTGTRKFICTVGRLLYFDQQAVEAFWAARQQDVGTGWLGTAGAGRVTGAGRTGVDRAGSSASGPSRSIH
ncbi:hypothetical protein [Streptomyces carpinensis]|uniref:Uncharacterized protein n=1 Tax=Streptomyces carpinensis TaxID=66369 RepID=A0ABV1W271_9ACTN|nr:hypothetical protein [Streptomyces carpinensis]